MAVAGRKTENQNSRIGISREGNKAVHIIEYACRITVSQLKKEENKFQEKVNQLVAENAKINNILSARMKEVQVLNNRVSLMAQENQSLLFRAQNMQVERDKYAATMETLKLVDNLYLLGTIMNNCFRIMRSLAMHTLI